jgi:hypothetical protein
VPQDPRKHPTTAILCRPRFVPPASIESGSASFILRVDDRTAWSSAASGGWLAVENQWPHMIGRAQTFGERLSRNVGTATFSRLIG